MKTNKIEGESELKFALKSILAGGLSGSIGEFCTIPIDSAKVILQV